MPTTIQQIINDLHVATMTDGAAAPRVRLAKRGREGIALSIGARTFKGDGVASVFGRAYQELVR